MTSAPTSGRVAVIGAGLVGLCTALTLQRAGHAVTVIDPRGLRRAASLGNAGCVNGSSIVPVAMPGVLRNVPGWLLDREGPLVLRWSYLPRMIPWLLHFIAASRPDRVQAQARALRALLGPALQAYRPLLQASGAADLLVERGYTIAYSSEAGWQGDAAGMRLRAENGVRIEELDARQMRERLPTLSERFVRGRYIGETGHFRDPGEVLRRFGEHFVANGGRFVEQEAREIVLCDALATGVRTSLGVEAADAVVICAGAWSAELARQLGDKVRLDTERGYHVELAGQEALLDAPVMWAEGKLFVTPMAGRLRAAGTVELAGLRAPPNWRRAELLLAQIKRMFPVLDQSLTLDRPGLAKWQGFRPSMPDSLPVIDRATHARNVLYGFGHGHVGLTGAATTARLLTELVEARPASIDLTAFAVRRFH